MSDRIPYWELHIRPMFRLLDHERMLSSFLGDRRIDLFDYDQVRAKAARILSRLREEPPGCMPPDTHGGPWPEEWIALFARWSELGFPRLDVPSAQWEARRTGDKVRVTARGNKASVTDNVWLDIVGLSPREYILHREPGPESDPDTFEATDQFVDANVKSVWITDAEGRREIGIG